MSVTNLKQFNRIMKQFKFTPSFLAVLKDGIGRIAHATVRELCAAHVGHRTQDRLKKMTP